MKKLNKLVLASIALIFVIALSSSALAQRPTRIVFARNTTSKTITGSLNGYHDKKNFVIRVRAGQTLRTTQIGDRHDITIYIAGPRGEDVGDSDASCNNRREVTPTLPGDYSIQVVECQKADRWRGAFKFRITVR
jgi:hypothetical protein